MAKVISSDIQRELDSPNRKGRINFFQKGDLELTPKQLREFIEPALVCATGMDKLGSKISIKTVVATAKYSRYAGCSCGCSPGFIVEGMKGYNLYADIK